MKFYQFTKNKDAFSFLAVNTEGTKSLFVSRPEPKPFGSEIKVINGDFSKPVSEKIPSQWIPCDEKLFRNAFAAASKEIGMFIEFDLNPTVPKK